MAFKNKEIIIGGISSKELLLFVKQMQAALRAGFSVDKALGLTLEQATGRQKQVLTDVLHLVSKGAYLHEAFAKYPKYFSPLFVNLVKTGELSGSLQENLLRLSGVLEKDRELKQKLRAAMVYPTFVFIAIIGLGFSVAYIVLPNLLPLFKSLKIQLPLSTRILLWVANLFDLYGMQILIGFVIFVIGLFILFKQSFFRPFRDWLLLHIPILGGLYHKIILARLGRTLASLLRSGISIDRALEITATIVTHTHFQQKLKQALPAILKGSTLSDVFSRDPKYFDPLFVKILALGEGTGTLQDSCDYAAEFYESEIDTRMKNLSVSLEPILLIFVGCMVGFVAIAILGPIYSITGSVR